MSTIVIASPQPLSGKTTVAVALAALARAHGASVALERKGDDGSAAADKETFSSLAAGGESSPTHTITELPAGEKSAPDGANLVVVATGDSPPTEVEEFAAAARVVLNRVPIKRAARIASDYESAGINVLASIPEDRLLAAPLLHDVIAALEAEASYLNNGAGLAPIDNPVIASISADPGQMYFTREQPSAVIVRSDKPDLLLSAINAGAPALIVTGGLPLLGYVLERAESDEIPLLRTSLDTVETVHKIEEMFGARPFAAVDSKIGRLEDLLAESDLASLLT